ncbi:MAG: cation:proton antiporter [bacterium]|nr:cation:proton antiporter [bacterium]
MDFLILIEKIVAVPEVQYTLLLFSLFVIPKWLQRYRIPSAITSLLLGLLAGVVFHLFPSDTTIDLLATFGIVAMFLFAGLEMDFVLIRRHWQPLAYHLGFQLLVMAILVWLGWLVFGLAIRPGIIFAMAIVTPSAGFIFDSLATLKVSATEREWIKSTVLATELMTLWLLFVVMQSTDVQRLAISFGVLLGMMIILPIIFQVFAKWIVPHAPKSEFAFLLMVAVVCSLITRRLGVYYLVGAFVVGITAQIFQKHIPAIASEKMLHAVEVFASFFIPLYFFNAGKHFHSDEIDWSILGIGILLTIVAVPIRIIQVVLHRKLILKETFLTSRRIGVALLPTLVFTIVL